MDYQKFINELSNIYNNWLELSICPKTNQFEKVVEQVKGMTTTNIMQLLNFAVECMEQGKVYCEVGCFQGATLIGALLNHPSQSAYAVDNFSEFDPLNENLEKLEENLATFGIAEQVMFCNQDFQEFFSDLRQLETSDKIGVYLYDGAHDYRSQLLGLLWAVPFLADRAVIVVDDSNWNDVRLANSDFLKLYPQCSILLDVGTPDNGHFTFWNGIQVMSWDTTNKS